MLGRSPSLERKGSEATHDDTEIRSRSEWRAHGPILIATCFVVGMLVMLSLMRYNGYNAGMSDIGNMSQAIWSATQGRPLEYTPPQFTWEQGNTSRLALHVELIYFALVPLYALLPDPRTLLVLQALWFGLGAWPVYRLGLRHLSSPKWALALTICYLFYPVAQTAVLFDFHGDTLAMPLLLFALEALDRRAWRSYAMWLVLALTCKFYVGAIAAALGAVLWWKGERRAGALTFVAGSAWLGLTLGVIRPLFAPPLATQSHATFASYVSFYFGGVGPALRGTAVERLLTAIVVAAPGLWLGRYAWRWCLPALVMALPALISLGGVSAYDYRFHHYALTVPFLILASVYGAAALRRRQEQGAPGLVRQRRPWQGELFLATGITVIFNVGLVDTPLNPQFWMDKPNWGVNEWKYGQRPRDRFKDQWLDRYVPEGAALVSNELVASHVINRQTVCRIRYTDNQKIPGYLEGAQYLVADALHDYALNFRAGFFTGGALQDLPALRVVMAHPDFGLLAAQDGLLLFGRDGARGAGLAQRFAVRPWAEGNLPPQLNFDGKIGLLAARIEPLGGRQFKLQFEWAALQPLNGLAPLFAVSRLEGAPHSRIVHLPTEVLHPTTAWQTGELVEETFEVVLPDELPAGTYGLWTGWYNSGNMFAAATDARSRLGDEAYIGPVTIEASVE